MTIQVRKLRILAACGALAVSMACAAQTHSTPSPSEFEPALRDLWDRGSERFLRRWLIASPISADAARSIDPVQREPAAGQELAAGIKWMPHTAWSNVTDVNVTPPRAPETDDRPVDRFVFVAGTLAQTAAGAADLSIGSQRPYSVWLNGKQVHNREATQTFSPDQDRVRVELQAGNNAVLLRFHETSKGPSQFALRVVPPGAALKRMDEISPSLVSSDEQSLAVRTHFTTESDAAPVTLEVIAAGGDVVTRQSATRGETIKLDPKSWRDGAYEIRLTTQNAWKQRQVRYLPWYKGDSIAAVRRLIATADAAKDDVPGDTVRMLAAMAKGRLGGSLDNASRNSWRLIHSPLMEFEELQLESQGRAARVRASGFVRIAYNDEIDGSTQFCRAYLPAEYSASKQWPLMLSLHGYNPANPQYVDWWSVDQRHHPVPENKPTIWIEPHGRGNAQYVGIGDRDVMHCLAEAKRLFSVDDDRVYVTGESMGGHGTWAIVTRHPDVFAAAAPVFGGWDLRVTTVSNPVSLPPPATSLEAYGFERASSFSNAENLLHVPLLVIHGDSDRDVHVANSRHAVQLLQRWGYDIRYHEMPGWAHEDLGQQATIADWLLTHRRVTSPSTIRLRSTDLTYASAYWIRVRALQNPGEVIRVAAEVLQPGVVRIDTTNVSALTLDLPASLRGSGDKLRVVWNGEPRELKASGAAELASGSSVPKPHKRAGLEGPLPAVLATPFIVVVGTTSPDARMR
ncbi:MAG: prolyl oligopeptidase family serine peptidase, partial [Steroidobacter sp.]